MGWSQRVISFVERIASHRLLARFTGSLIGKFEEYAENGKKTRKSFPEITLLTFLSWMLKGFEWYFIGLAVGITQIEWLGFFLLHPLITALGFVPITPAGAGFQEGAVVGIFALLGIAPETGVALTFALLSRLLLIGEDLIGVPQIAKSTSSLVFSRKTANKPTIE
jgi:uncharacterized protein (TIRG00374 family)